MEEFFRLVLSQLIALLLTNYFFFSSQVLQITPQNVAWQFKKCNYWRPIFFCLLSILLSWKKSFIIYSIGLGALMTVLILILEKKAQYKPYIISQIIQFIAVALAVSIETDMFKHIKLSELKTGLFGEPFLIYTLGFLMCLGPSNAFIKVLLKSYKFSPLALADDGLLKAGRFIGNIERMIALLFVLDEQYEAIGFFIAAKSLLRLKEDKFKFSEYILIGTLLSFGIAIVIGLIIKKLL